MCVVQGFDWIDMAVCVLCKTLTGQTWWCVRVVQGFASHGAVCVVQGFEWTDMAVCVLCRALQAMALCVFGSAGL